MNVMNRLELGGVHSCQDEGEGLAQAMTSVRDCPVLSLMVVAKPFELSVLKLLGASVYILHPGSYCSSSILIEY